MAGFFKFWWAAIRSAFAFGWVVFGAVSTLLPATVSLIQKYWPSMVSIKWIKWISENQVEVTCAIPATVLVAYLAYAPYRLYKTQGQELTRLRQQFENQITRTDTVEQLGRFLAAGQNWLQVCSDAKRTDPVPVAEIEKWHSDVQDFLKRQGDAYVVRYNSTAGLLPMSPSSLAPGVEQNLWYGIHVRCTRINQFLSELSP